MRSPVVKRQTLPRSGFLPVFSAGVQAERRSPLATCAVCLSGCWCSDGAAPHPYGGARAAVTPRAETTPSDFCDLETSRYPGTGRCQEAAERPAFAREAQARGRGSPRQPDTTFAVWISAGADGPATGRAQGRRPLGSWAFATQGHQHNRARERGVSRERPVRPRAHPRRS
jgi:hypothetical protein